MIGSGLIGNTGQLWPKSRLRPTPAQTSVDSTVSEIISRLGECDEQHSTCSNGLPQQLPKRILDISEATVVLREQVAGVHRYACLSHCWGREGPEIKTTASTLKAHEAGIPFHRLPKTFRESVELCIRLGIRYIWRDALCV